jgi:hypothetical protein
LAGVLCSGCGTLNTTATKFCIECGTAMSAAPSERVEPARPSVAAETAGTDFAQSPLLQFFLKEQTGSEAALRTAVIAALIFVGTFAGYFLSTHLRPEPGPSLEWIEPLSRYTFYADLAEAMNHGSFDLREAGIAPETHPDLLTTDDGKVILPYQPMPGVMLMPFVAIWGQGSTQITFSMILGAINVVLFWYLLRQLSISRETKLLLVPFFAFGTAHFYSATTGTLWFYNHMTGVFFLLLALIFLVRRDSPILPALFLGGAALSRQPMVLAVPAFLYFMIEQRNPGVFSGIDLVGAIRNVPDRLRDGSRRLRDDRKTLATLGVFVGVLVPFAFITFWYNDVRFGNIFETGLDELYTKYDGVPYNQYLAAGGQRFGDDFPFILQGDFDIRNIPIHLYTISLQPPEFSPDGSVFKPSTFGMSVLLTSSPLVYSVFVRRQDALKRACWIGVALVAIPTLLYYSAGWVQFGYRYMLDYLPFLMILTAFGFDDHRSPKAFRVKVALVVLSIAIGFWGRYWGTRLGW